MSGGPVFGKFTPDMMQLVMQGAGVQRHLWARLLVYLTDKIVTGDRLGYVETVWLKDYLDDVNARLRTDYRLVDCLVVQVVRKRIADEVFSGYPESVSRAIGDLEDMGLLALIHKGVKGHGSLYLMDIAKISDRGAFDCKPP